MADSLLDGLVGHLRGLVLVISDKKLVMESLHTALLLVSSATCLACGVWIPCLLLRLPPISSPVSLDSLLLPSSLVVMYMTQLWPGRVGGVFFGALAVCSAEEARQLRALPVVRGPASALASMFTTAVLSLSALFLCASTAPFWLPFLSVNLLFIPVLAIPFFLSFAVAARLAPLAAFGRIGQVSVVFAVLLVFGWLLGRVPTAVIELLSEGLVLSCTHGKLLLGQLGARASSRQWHTWCNTKSLSLVGLGLPVWALMRFAHPLLGLALLELQFGAAGFFVHGQLSDFLEAAGTKDI